MRVVADRVGHHAALAWTSSRAVGTAPLRGCASRHRVRLFRLKADSERVFSQHLQNQLLPDHTYAAVSGGAPLCIPDLTWEQLREFHAKHYHPSNAR